jgi:hypothetical protein
MRLTALPAENPPAERNVKPAWSLDCVARYLCDRDGPDALGNQFGDLPPSRGHSDRRCINVKKDRFRRHRMCYSR